MFEKATSTIGMSWSFKQNELYEGLTACGFSEKYSNGVVERLPKFLASLRLIGVSPNNVLITKNGDILFQSNCIDVKYDEFLATIALILYDNQHIRFDISSNGIIESILHFYGCFGEHYKETELKFNGENSSFKEVHKKNGTKPITRRR